MKAVVKLEGRSLVTLTAIALSIFVFLRLKIKGHDLALVVGHIDFGYEGIRVHKKGLTDLSSNGHTVLDHLSSLNRRPFVTCWTRNPKFDFDSCDDFVSCADIDFTCSHLLLELT